MYPTCIVWYSKLKIHCMWQKRNKKKGCNGVMTVTSHPSLVTPTRVYSQSRPHPNSPWPNPNPSQAFPKGCCTDVCLVSIPEAVNTIPKHIWPIFDKLKTSRIPLTNPELARSPLNPKTQYTQLWLGEAQMPSYIPNWVLFLFSRTYFYLSLLTLISFLLSLLSSVNPVSV